MDKFWALKTSKKRKREESDQGQLPDEAELGGVSFMDLLGGMGAGGADKDNIVKSENNHIYMYSEITRKTAYEVGNLIKTIASDNMTIADRYDVEPSPIYLHINSYGGSVFAALAIIDSIKDCQKKVPVHTVVEGCAASAATLIGCVGSKRYIKKHAHMLIHELRSGVWGKYSDLEEEMENLKKLMDVIISIYQEHTKLKGTKKLTNLLKKDSWWSAEECLKNQLVDSYWEDRYY